MRLPALIVATVMAVATVIFHIMSGSALWIMAFRAVVTWCGFAALVLFFDYALKWIFSRASHYESSVAQRKRLDLVSRPEEDSAFYK